MSINRYHRTVEATATPPELLLALYDGALRYIARADACIAAGDAAGKGEALGRTMQILAELGSALDAEAAPKLAGHLAPLYLYFSRRLERASLYMDPAPLAEVTGHLQSLRTTWAEAIASL